MKATKKEQTILLCGPRRPLTQEEIDNGYRVDYVNCKDCGADIMYRPDPDFPDDILFQCVTCASQRIGGGTADIRTTKQNREHLEKLGLSHDNVEEALEVLLGAKPPFWRGLLRSIRRIPILIVHRWWSFRGRVDRILYATDLMRLATYNDADFTLAMEEFQNHPSPFVRALAATRWSRVTWPNDHPNRHRLDVDLVWGREGE